MAHYLLFYDVAPDYLERRALYREAHLAHAWAAVERGELVLGGALAEPADRAVLLFNVDDPGIVDAFARQDPYVLSGIVVGWSVRPWTTVVGKDASAPVGLPHS